jgi:hypothetical protein
MGYRFLALLLWGFVTGAAADMPFPLETLSPEALPPPLLHKDILELRRSLVPTPTTEIEHRAQDQKLDIGYVYSDAFGRKAVVYEAMQGLAVFEGDIVLGTVEEARSDILAGPMLEQSMKIMGVGLRDGTKRWPDGKIPFCIASGFSDDQETRIRAAISHWTEKLEGVIHWHEQASQDGKCSAEGKASRVRFVPYESGCIAEPGRHSSREQSIWLSDRCSFGSIVHEMGHTVGLWHEQGREDRDKHVKIVLENVAPTDRHNFTQLLSRGIDLGDYDYGSIMHYPANAFVMPGRSVSIVARRDLPQGVFMGQRDALSTADVAAVRKLYGQLPLKVPPVSNYPDH